MRAIDLCERQRRKRPFAPAAYRQLVDLYIAGNNHRKVAEICDDLTMLGYGSAALAKKHAYALCHLERFQQAIEVLESTLRLEGSDPWVLECLGNCYFTFAEYQRARRAYLRCLEMNLGGEVRARVQGLVRQVDVLLGYRRGEDEGL